MEIKILPKGVTETTVVTAEKGEYKRVYQISNEYKTDEIITTAQMNTFCDCAGEPKEKDTYVCQYCRQLNWINDLSCTSCGGEQG